MRDRELPLVLPGFDESEAASYIRGQAVGSPSLWRAHQQRLRVVGTDVPVAVDEERRNRSDAHRLGIQHVVAHPIGDLG